MRRAGNALSVRKIMRKCYHPCMINLKNLKFNDRNFLALWIKPIQVDGSAISWGI